MEEEQYLTEKNYLVCSKGMAPKQMKVTSQNFTYMSGHLAHSSISSSTTG